MNDKGVCKDCNNRKYCEDYKPNKWQCEDYEVQHTNEEWLECLTTEEKAKFILNIREHCYYCGAKQILDRERCPFRDGKCRNNLHEFVGWLKEKHHDSVQG